MPLYSVRSDLPAEENSVWHAADAVRRADAIVSAVYPADGRFSVWLPDDDRERIERVREQLRRLGFSLTE